MGRKRLTRFQRFKRRSGQVSSASAIAALLSLAFKNKRLANRLLNVSAVSGISSVLPSRKTLNRLRGRGKKFSRAGKTQLAANAFRLGEGAAFLLTSRVAPVLAFTGGSILLNRRARRLRKERRPSSSRRRRR